MASRQWYLVCTAVCNVLLFSNASFVSTPKNSTELRAVLKRSLELQCSYSGSDGNGEFLEWYKDGVLVSKDKPGHYVVKSTPTESLLIIKIFVTADANVKKWHVKSAKTGYEQRDACVFDQIPLIPTPQGIETNVATERLEGTHESIRRVEDQPVSLRCVIKPLPSPSGTPSLVNWEYSRDDSSYQPITASDVELMGDTLTISQVKKTHRGYYRCTSNSISFDVLLRVKDRFAALWPFLGIVAIVLVLVIVILIFEKRQKSTRRTVVNDEDENEHANDPLVRSSNKTADTDNKKRAVKA